jgi:signal transduction histidine kinase
MSVISVQAGMGGYVFVTDPDTAQNALSTIAATSREALEELRRMLTVLRSATPDESATDSATDTASYAPIPSLDRLGEVAGRVRAAGVPVELRITGESRPLEPGVELCAFRVVQEALTNVLKHAYPARATVLLEYRPHHLLVSVIDDGSHRSDPATIAPVSGHGLIGMRERAKLYGGTVDIGRRTEGGFGVRLILPTSAQADRRGDQLPG